MSLFDTLLEHLVDAMAAKGGDAARLFHGRGHCYDGLEHLSVDWLEPVLLLTCFAPLEAGWAECLAERCRALWPEVGALMVQERHLPGAPARLLFGELPQSHQVSEAGLAYRVRLGRNQNTGLFLDMAEGRRWVREHAQERKMLNLFAYTCGFSVAALKGGADLVVNLDMSRGALEQGRENHRLNQLDLRRVQFLPYELFRSWGKVRRLGPYDLVVIDPPSFQKGSFVATKDYQRVLRRLPELLTERAEVLACLNDPAIGPDFLIEQMQELCPGCRFVERIANPPGFPERYPEKGLKVLRFAYQGG